MILAKKVGTTIKLAKSPDLTDMWNRVVFLLGITVYEEDMPAHIDNIKLLSLWVKDSFPEMTCEEVYVAYNLACRRMLKVDEVFSILSPKHVGQILAAYREYVNASEEMKTANKVMLLEAEKENADQINEKMEGFLAEAIEQTRAGKNYYDGGNGLFDWLWRTGQLKLTEEEGGGFYDRASKVLPQLLEREKKDLMPHQTTAKAAIEVLLKQIEIQTYNQDNENRIMAHAKRLALLDYLRKQVTDGNEKDSADGQGFQGSGDSKPQQTSTSTGNSSRRRTPAMSRVVPPDQV